MMEKVCFGVDIGGTAVKIGIFTLTGKLFDKWEIPTRTEERGKYILSDIAASINEALSIMKIRKSDVTGVGLGVPGPVKEDGTVLMCVNLGWGIFNVADELSQLLKLPVKAANDANVAAFGEMWQGGGAGHLNIVMVTLGTGCGGGIILDGKIVAGTHGAAGEIGHTPALAEEDIIGVCGCGKRGCLEQIASATGISKMATKYVKELKMPGKLSECDHITAKAVLDAAKEGDETASLVVEKMASYLGNALAVICAVVDPEIIVIGGGVSKAGQYLIDTIEKHYQGKAFQTIKDIEFALAKLGNDAGIYGAARMVGP